MSVEIVPVRTPEQIAAVSDLVWGFFDFLRLRYPEMHGLIDAYIAEQDVAGGLADFEAHFMPPHGAAFLALLDGQPVGSIMLKPRGDGDGEMNRMFVRDAARGRGVGRKLALVLIAEARALGYRTLHLGALYRHVEALPLYESLGFVRTDPPEGGTGRQIRMKMAL